MQAGGRHNASSDIRQFVMANASSVLFEDSHPLQPLSNPLHFLVHDQDWHTHLHHFQLPQHHLQQQMPPSFPHLTTHQKLYTSPQELQAVRQHGNAKWDYSDLSCLLPSSSSQTTMVSVAKEGFDENRWAREETIALIKGRSEIGTNSKDSKHRAPICSEVSRKLDELGFQRRAKKCKEKFPSMMKDGNGHQKSQALFTELEKIEGVAHLAESRKKRKRTSCSSTMVSIKCLAKQLLEQQQVLHSRFLESIEQRDRESMLREEAVRKQEAARLRKEQELRAQEVAIAASRNAVMVELLHKVTGQKNSNAIVSKGLCEDIKNESTRWPKVEIHALIRLRSGMEGRFQEARGPNAQLWKEISWSMACMGYNRSAKRCKEKWENINKYFKKMKDSSPKRSHNAKTCPYFHPLQTLYETGILGSTSSRCNKLEDNAEPVYPPLTPTRSSSKASVVQLSQNCEQSNSANTEINFQKAKPEFAFPTLCSFVSQCGGEEETGW